MFNTVTYFLLAILLISCKISEPTLESQIKRLHDAGKFNAAESLITHYIKNNPDLPAKKITALHFEIERGKRIMHDFRLNEGRFTQKLSEAISDFSREEFETWERQGRFDILYVNGQKRYANPSLSNLFFRYPELRDRKNDKSTYSANARLTLQLAQELKQKRTQYPDPVFPPRICRVQQVLSVKEGRVPPGEIVSCWIPYPTVFQTQGYVKFVSANPEPFWIDHATSPIRSVFLRKVMPPKGDLEFKVEYEYGASAYYRDVDAAKVEPYTGDESLYVQYTKEEAPHKIFSPELRTLTHQIIGDETNPYKKAYRIYNWIADSIKYSYAREYSTLRNISEYCYTNRYGDCGQEAILFITLCRIAGVPARWQSGFFTFPNDEGMHDWSEIYIKPYGWLPVDTYMGIYFTSIIQDLTPDERTMMRRFYFGNIDHFRLVANKGHNQKLYPPKQHFRSETVDFQRGEVEWRGGNLYFPDWRWRLTVTEIK